MAWGSLKESVMGGESRVSRENEVFEDRRALDDGPADLGSPTPADAIPKPADPHGTGEDAYPADEDVDETLAGGLAYPDRAKDAKP
jgi:hypothetical protein